MRTTLLLVMLTATSVLALSTLPTVERSAAVFTGRVISTEKVTVQKDPYFREIWRAAVKLHTVTKQDTNLVESVFVYYEQPHTTVDGVMIIRGCPGYPQLVVGATNKFFCIRRDAGDAKNTLFIPEGGWVTAP